MSVFDKIIAAVTPPESDQKRQEAYDTARGLAGAGDWLDQILEHHDAIRTAFMDVKDAETEESQTEAQEYLATILMGHAVAEEGVIYPAMALDSQKAHAEMGYNEQAMVKVQLAALDNLPRLSRDYLDKLEHIEGAVLHHMYQEEGTWFPDLKRQKGIDHDKLTILYAMEFGRYAGVDEELTE